MTIGERLRMERNRLGMSQPSFAALAGTTKQTLFSWESGKTAPDGFQMAALGAHGVDLLFVLTGQRTPPAQPADALPDGERRLLNGYRLCGPEAQQHLIQTAALLAAGLPSASPSTHGGMHMSNQGSGNVQIGSVGGSYQAVPPKPSPRKKTTK